MIFKESEKTWNKVGKWCVSGFPPMTSLSLPLSLPLPLHLPPIIKL